MNSCQFGEVDMNLDGIKDFFVFDRHGDRIMTFINGGIAATLITNMLQSTLIISRNCLIGQY